MLEPSRADTLLNTEVTSNTTPEYLVGIWPCGYQSVTVGIVTCIWPLCGVHLWIPHKVWINPYTHILSHFFTAAPLLFSMSQTVQITVVKPESLTLQKFIFFFTKIEKKNKKLWWFSRLIPSHELVELLYSEIYATDYMELFELVKMRIILKTTYNYRFKKLISSMLLTITDWLYPYLQTFYTHNYRPFIPTTTDANYYLFFALQCFSFSFSTHNYRQFISTFTDILYPHLQTIVPTTTDVSHWFSHRYSQ